MELWGKGVYYLLISICIPAYARRRLRSCDVHITLTDVQSLPNFIYSNSLIIIIILIFFILYIHK